MLTLSFKIGCRSCSTTDGIEHNYMVNASKPHQPELEQEYRAKSEYEICKLIERWRFEDQHTCSFCNSKNISVDDVKVNGHALYEFEHVLDKAAKSNSQIVKLSIDKKGNNLDIRFDDGLKIYRQYEEPYFEHAIDELLKLFNTPPSPYNYLTASDNGKLFACLVGYYSPVTKTYSFTVERYYHNGINIQAIMFVLNDLRKNKLMYIKR